MSDDEHGVSPPTCAIVAIYSRPLSDARCHREAYSPWSSSALAIGSLRLTDSKEIGLESEAFQAALPYA